MKIITKIFLWISMILHGAIFFIILFVLFEPLYLAITKGEEYVWTGIIGIFLIALIGIALTFILSKYIKNHYIPTKKILLFYIFLL